MVPNRFQYFLDYFWNFENFDQIWARRPHYYKNALKYRKIWNHLQNILKKNVSDHVKVWTFSIFRNHQAHALEYLILNNIIFSEDEDVKMIVVAVIKSTKALIFHIYQKT